MFSRKKIVPVANPQQQQARSRGLFWQNITYITGKIGKIGKTPQLSSLFHKYQIAK
jgi:hypothetical protein